MKKLKKIVLISLLLCVIGLMSAGKSGTVRDTVADSTQSVEVAAIQDECSFEDVEITAAEFDSALHFSDQQHYIRSEREPNATDTAYFLEWLKSVDQPESLFDMDECFCYTFEGTDFVEMGLGDYCCTRFHGDTERAANVYKGIKPLTGDDIADVAVYAANAPAHVQIAEVLILATHQGSGSVIVRK